MVPKSVLLRCLVEYTTRKPSRNFLGKVRLLKQPSHSTTIRVRAFGTQPSSGGEEEGMDAEIYQYLTEQLDTDDIELHRGILKALKPVYGNSVKVSHLKQFGKDGMKALADAVVKELEKSNAKSNKSLPSIPVHFKIPHHKTEFDLQWRLGQSLLDVAKNNDPHGLLTEYMEGTCGGTMSCCTCHVYLDEDTATYLTPAEEAEIDMLDLAYEPDDTLSRLACQVKLTEDLWKRSQTHPVTVTIPSGVHNVWHVNAWH